MRYLAIDHGTKRTGLAICDPDETIVSPLAVIEGQQGLIEMIARTVATEHAEAIVLGLPLNMDDSAGPQAKLVLKFAEQLEKVLDIPVHFQDERLSTFGAQDKLAATELTKKKKKKHLDAIAAAEILETFLEDKNR
jgi:putative Holliday junction resolvase